MAIGRVEQKGSSVYVYSASGGSLLWAKNGNLISWNSREVHIESCGHVYVYDEYGHEI